MKRNIILLLISLLFLKIITIFLPTSNDSKPVINSINATQTIIDQYMGVEVYSNTNEALPYHYSKDGYPYGRRWQCVEFIKRFYYDAFQHAMPDVYGNAVDFFDTTLQQGALNKDRNMYQYQNSNNMAPKTNDLLVFDKTATNPYGHVAIIIEVTPISIKIIQQNTGNYSRSELPLQFDGTNYNVIHPYMKALGWLRLPN